MDRLGEIALISDYLAPLATHPASLGLKDDAALLTGLPESGLVITADALVAGVHFFEDDDPGDAAYKAVATNVSDLAAKGARPIGYTMTLALPQGPDKAWAEHFTAGLAKAHTRFDIALLGGDTVTTGGSWWIAITAFGEAPSRGLVPRSGARPGHQLYVSGTLGDSALGLRVRLDKEFGADLPQPQRDFLLSRYLFPEPRLALRTALTQFASAAMDISDGLALDLKRLCLASKASAEVLVTAIPLSDAMRSVLAENPDAMAVALSGGDDYEILAAIPPESAAAFETASRDGGVRVTRIGTVTAGLGEPRFLKADGSEFVLTSQGFEHFKT